jgi:pyruvate dehydrogenase E2 component (dihydrolipoamide acetyltransferase)
MKMATPVIMPRQGQSVDSCVIGEWHKKKGDAVRVGDLLFTYETDKATFDEEARVEGTLLAVFFADGDDVACLTNVCVIGDEGEEWSTFIPEDATTDGHTPSCDQTSSSTEKSPPHNRFHRYTCDLHAATLYYSTSV